MNYQLGTKKLDTAIEIELPASKSISNRLLIAQALASDPFIIHELSDAEDTKTLQRALTSITEIKDVGMAGTAFRFLTAYYAISEGSYILTGAARMKNRPIGVLVEELKKLGAEIYYLEKEGYPPLKIVGKKLQGRRLFIDASVSSQYISALMLIAPYLKNGLRIELKNQIVSYPYLQMTMDIQRSLGANVSWENEIIEIDQGEYYCNNSLNVEKDWSSAAFFYQLTALGKKTIFLKGLHKNSIQGDRACADLFDPLGVETEFKANGVLLKPKEVKKEHHRFEMLNCPDLIPSVAVTASCLFDRFTIEGVETLRKKESNRVEALSLELEKLNIRLTEKGTGVIQIEADNARFRKVTFETHNDHRMAMTFAALVFKCEKIKINDVEVVEKSFPDFWKELAKVGVEIERIN